MCGEVKVPEDHLDVCRVCNAFGQNCGVVGEREAGSGIVNADFVFYISASASKSSIRRFIITEKAPTRAFSWLKAATTAFTFKTLLRHYAKRALTPPSLNVKLGR